MEMDKFLELKAKGAARMQRLGADDYQIIVKRYDEHTGKEKRAEVVPCTRESMRTVLVQVKEQLEKNKAAQAALESVLAEMDKLDAAEAQSA